MRKKILVTGGAGFIGANFVKYILETYPNYFVIVLDSLTYAGRLDNFPIEWRNNLNFTFIQGDVRDIDLVMNLVSQVDIVVHLAAETHVPRSINNNQLFFDTNILGTHSVANAVLKHKKKIEKFVHVSTSEVYGTALLKPMDETHPINPKNPYAASKTGADRLIYSYWCTYAIPVVILRPFNQYGPFQHLEKVIPRFITNALLNEPLMIHGEGKARRDWLFVEDICKAIDLVLHASEREVIGEIFNIGSGNDIDILSIARMIVDKLEKSKLLIEFMEDRPGQVSHNISSTRKAQRILGLKPKTNFEDGLEQTIEWYAKNQQWWEKLLPMRHVEIFCNHVHSTLY